MISNITRNDRNRNLNLVVVAHPDDEILGCGATSARRSREGDTFQAVILCGMADQRTLRPTDEILQADTNQANLIAGFDVPILGTFPNIRLNGIDHIELVKFIEEQIERFRPSRIFTHHPGDLNNDHEQVSRACQAACRLFQRRNDLPKLRSLHFMEILSSTEWGFGTTSAAFQPNTFVEVGPHLETKLQALACYRHVMRSYPHPRSEETLRGLAALRGSQAGHHYAEAFQTVFMGDLP